MHREISPENFRNKRIYRAAFELRCLPDYENDDYLDDEI